MVNTSVFASLIRYARRCLEENVIVTLVEYVGDIYASVDSLCKQILLDLLSLLAGNAFLVLKLIITSLGMAEQEMRCATQTWIFFKR